MLLVGSRETLLSGAFIAEFGAEAYHEVARPMHHQHRLLLIAFDRHKAHVRLASASFASFLPLLRYGFTNCAAISHTVCPR